MHATLELRAAYQNTDRPAPSTYHQQFTCSTPKQFPTTFMNSLEVNEIQKEVSLLKSAVEVLDVRTLKKKLEVIVYVRCRCTLTHNAHVSEYCTHTPTHKIVGLISIVGRKNLAINLPKPSTHGPDNY